MNVIKLLLVGLFVMEKLTVLGELQGEKAFYPHPDKLDKVIDLALVPIHDYEGELIGWDFK